MTDHADDGNDPRAAAGRTDADWDLIRRVGAGDQAALERLYRQYYDYLYRFVFQITRRTDYVEEVINEVMFVVWEKAARVVPGSRASTWILGIAHNKALQVMYRGRSAGSVVFDDERHTDYATDDQTALRELEAEELLFAAMKSLAPEQRAVMELVYYHGLHYSEIAEVIGCPENTVKTRVFHARRRLRALWPELTGGRISGTTGSHDG